MDETPKFEPYQPVRVSKLEPCRAEIAEMSRQGWPLKKIREFLSLERNVKVSLSRLCVYCQSRKIRKGRGEVAASRDPNPQDAERRLTPEQTATLPNDEANTLSALLPANEPGNPFTKFKPKNSQ